MKWSDFHAKYGSLVEKIANRYDLDPALLGGLIMQESGGNPNAKSHCGAYGLTQIMPATAVDHGYDLSSPEGQIRAGAHYLNWLKRNFSGDDETLMLAAYNAGPGRLKNDQWRKYKDTRDYVIAVPKRAAAYREFLQTLEEPTVADEDRAGEAISGISKPHRGLAWRLLYWLKCKGR